MLLFQIRFRILENLAAKVKIFKKKNKRIEEKECFQLKNQIVKTLNCLSIIMEYPIEIKLSRTKLMFTRRIN